ncbi:MAG: HAMP domain-containing histidine kinase [Pedobacter sp.]|nr:MAG: HAMP domain-containing histidine kinase [Pedobacter sp.]
MSLPINQIKRPLSRYVHSMIGSPNHFDLPSRIFHSITLGAFIIASSYFFYNILVGMYVAAISCIILSGTFYFEYFRSRFKGQPHRSLVFGIAGLIILSTNYFANAGIDGSTDLIWPVFLLLLITICKRKNIVIWTLIYIAAFTGIHLVEYFYPTLVDYPFNPGKGQFIDRMTAFPIPVIGIVIIVSVLRINYDRERAIAMQRDAEKVRLLSILSHDLRTPFVQVQQYLDLLDNDYLSTEERKEMERALRKKNDQTLLLVSNLLYWSRSQLEGFKMRQEKQMVASVLKNTIEHATATAIDKQITLQADIPANLHCIADADMLQLVIRNLLQNATKFTAAGGEIKLKAWAESDWCIITITDQGTGIPAAQIETLFSNHTTTPGTSNEKGVGLGLQLCAEFMALQGGSIQAESEVGKGSTFTVKVKG